MTSDPYETLTAAAIINLLDLKRIPRAAIAGQPFATRPGRRKVGFALKTFPVSSLMLLLVTPCRQWI